MHKRVSIEFGRISSVRSEHARIQAEMMWTTPSHVHGPHVGEIVVGARVLFPTADGR